MKKLLAFATVAILLVLALSVFAQEATQEKAAGQPARKRPAAKTEEEYTSYIEITKITEIADQAKKAELAQAFLDKFKQSEMRGMIYRDLIIAYATLNNPEKAFEAGKQALSEDPNNLSVLLQLANTASDLVLKGNKSFTNDGIAYGKQVAEKLEAGDYPAEYSPEQWQQQRDLRMGLLYRSIGILQIDAKQNEAAIDSLNKAIKHQPRDFFSHYMLGRAQAAVYESIRVMAQAEKNRARQQELINKLKGIREQMIMSYARAVVTSEGPGLENMNKTIDSEMRALYQSTSETKSLKGLPEIIAKVKTEFN